MPDLRVGVVLAYDLWLTGLRGSVRLFRRNGLHLQLLWKSRALIA